jgi:putative ABC transport system permease protein
MEIIQLSTWNLALAASMIVLLAAVSLLLRLGITRSVLVSGTRMILQLSLVGLILHWVFAQTNPLWVALIALTMVAVGGIEIMRRQTRRFAGFWGYGVGTLSMLTSSFLLTSLALTAVIRVEPWYTPQYAIPLLGMMLGNTMNGVSLGIDRLTQTAWQQRQVIEARLALGETAINAIGDIRRESMRAALMPIINAMSIIGLVSLPGMMTGQILAGNDPAEAVKYQIMIMCFIGGGTGLGSVVAVSLASHRLFDLRQRLRLDRLVSA